MRFPINVEVNDDVWSGTCPSIRGVSATGGTLAELRSSLSAELISQLHQILALNGVSLNSNRSMVMKTSQTMYMFRS